MRTISIPEDDEQNYKMNAHTMMGDSSQSFAKEAIQLLSEDSRKSGVSGYKKHKKGNKIALLILIIIISRMIMNLFPVILILRLRG